MAEANVCLHVILPVATHQLSQPVPSGFRLPLYGQQSKPRQGPRAPFGFDPLRNSASRNLFAGPLHSPDGNAYYNEYIKNQIWGGVMNSLKLAITFGAITLLSVMGFSLQAQAAGSCSSEYSKCTKICRDNPQWTNCPATCRSSKSSCLKTGTFKYKRQSSVSGLAKK